MNDNQSQGGALPKTVKQVILDKCKELGYDSTQFEARLETISDDELVVLLKAFFDLRDKQDQTKSA